MKNYILARLHEASTWRGLTAGLTAVGVVLSPAQRDAIIALGLAVMGTIGVFFPDSKPNA